MKRFLISLITLFISALCAAQELPILLSGCSTLPLRNACKINPASPLTIWVPHRINQSVSIMIDARRVSPLSAYRVDLGTRYELVVPVENSILQVMVEQSSTKINLLSYPRPQVLTDARSLNRKGELDQAITLLRTELASVSDHWRGTAYRLLGQALRRQGLVDQAMDAVRRSVDADLYAGLRSSAIRTSTNGVFIHIENGDYGLARKHLLNIVEPKVYDSDSRYNLAYFQGMVAHKTGDVRTALRQLDAAAKLAEKTGSPAQRLYSELLLAIQLQRLGRHQAALNYLSRWNREAPPDVRPCEQSLMLTNIGWASLLLLEAGIDAEDPIETLEQANKIGSDQCGAYAYANTLVNLALANWHEENLDSAQLLVNQARQIDGVGLQNALWLADIDARIALSRGDNSQALKKYQKLDLLAQSTLSFSAQWRALVGIARSYTSQGDLEAAIEAYARAEQILARYLPAIPIDQGRESVLSMYASATREHIGLLVTQQKEQAAFELSRRLRVQGLNHLNALSRTERLTETQLVRWDDALSNYQEVRQELESSLEHAWMLPADELNDLNQANAARRSELHQILDRALSVDLSRTKLAAPVEDGLTVLIQPLPRGWVVFLHDGVVLNTLQPNCSVEKEASTMACVVAAIKMQLANADTVYLQPAASINHIDIHAIALEGKALATWVPIVYQQDLGRFDQTQNINRRAFLVADTAGDLDAARRELMSVSSVLKDDPRWTSKQLNEGEVTFNQMIGELEQSELFHFAGHARFGGELGWQSELKLTEDTGLTVSDILALRKAPSLVVLSGCETAKTTTKLVTESISLAHAFLLAGSNQVLATTRPVRDDVAEQLMSEFYSHWINGVEPAVALQRAQIALIHQDAESDWSAYRILAR